LVVKAGGRGGERGATATVVSERRATYMNEQAETECRNRFHSAQRKIFYEEGFKEWKEEEAAAVG
jgi:hypothetical protein